ncbi:MAG: threonine synthase [Xanthomonadales bacterium]|nr:threonine synthase [Xanthomonadales bacterium]
MNYLRCWRGLASGGAYALDAPMNLDPVDGRPVQLELDLDRLQHDHPGRSWLREQRSMWRYGPLLPFDSAGDESPVVTLGEGWTPLLGASDLPGAKRAGLNLYVKDEGFHWPGYGGNPTLSFKDRGMSMVASMARHYGLRRLAVPTQGNAGDSLCRYAQAAGAEVAVIMPEDTPEPIVGSVAAAAARNPGVILDFVTGTIREAGARMKEFYLPRGYFNCATFQEPGWRIEGKKTLGLEIAEQLAWRFPDAIVYPTGGGTGILGMWKAFTELQQLGVVEGDLPRMYCIQAEATAPLAEAWRRGAEDSESVSPGATLATGLNVPGGVGHFAVLRTVRESGGSVLAVSEAEIEAAFREVWQRKHWWICPEGAACLAALDSLVEGGQLRRDETVIVVNTGSFEKYLPNLRGWLVA